MWFLSLGDDFFVVDNIARNIVVFDDIFFALCVGHFRGEKSFGWNIGAMEANRRCSCRRETNCFLNGDGDGD